MDDDEAADTFPPPDADNDELADAPDPAFDETDDDEDETPTPGEPD